MDGLHPNNLFKPDMAMLREKLGLPEMQLQEEVCDVQVAEGD